jgi:hypothetical protein
MAGPLCPGCPEQDATFQKFDRRDELQDHPAGVGWDARLSQAGFTLRGHRPVRRPRS